MRFKWFLIWMILPLMEANAQLKGDRFIHDILESMAENLSEDLDLSELEDRLIFFSKHPINLNKTNAEALNSLVFLSPLQIGSLFNYLQKYGALVDVYELQCVPEFDQQTLERLLPFVSINPFDLQPKITLTNLAKYSNNDLIIRLGRILESSKGFLNLTGSRYLGSPEKYLFRYKYTYFNRLSASLVFKKDAGEHFFNGPKQYPFDFQSAHIALYQTGFLKKLVLGDYTLQYGQALTLWTGFSFGKSSDITSIVKRDVALKSYTSANEFAFLRGLAATIALAKNVEFTSFYSNRNLQASINLLNGEETVATINQTGLHRTNTEINNKNALNQQSYGGIFTYQNARLTLGAIGYAVRYNKNFVPASSLYRNFNFAGKQLNNAGIYYNYTFKNFYFYGEGAQSFMGGRALVAGILASLSSKINGVIHYRNIAKNYHNFFNQASTENSDAINENGLYAGLNINPNAQWAISLYSDYFKFPWLRYRVNAPSDGYEFLAQIQYNRNKSFQTLVRYRYKLKPQNTDLAAPIYYLEDVIKEGYRLDVNWKLTKKWATQSRVEVSKYQKKPAKSEIGYLVYQDIDYRPLSSKLSANVRIAYFNTPSYNSRIYAYENDVLYSFTFGLYNGKGIRTYLNLKYRFAKRLEGWLRYAITKYPGVESIGSGLDEIKGSVKSDARLQIRYQF